MAFRIVDVNHKFKSMRDVDVVAVDVLPGVLQGFWKIEPGLEDVFLIIHDWVFRVLVVVFDEAIIWKLHICLRDVGLVNFGSIAA